MKILVVDDDPQLRSLVGLALDRAGFAVVTAADGQSALMQAARELPDLIVLDQGLPELDGLEVCRRIRAKSEVPIVFLTARDDELDRVLGLELGADDYVTKPFSMEELYLRISVVLRRTGSKSGAQPQQTNYQVGRYAFSPAARELALDGQTTKLSAIESKLLLYFCDANQGIIDRDTALRRVWGDDDRLRSRSLNVYVSKLRQYLKDDPGIEILNIHGEGYQMVVRLI